MKYREYTISKAGMNYSIRKPNGERFCSEVPATIATAKKWIDLDIHEQQVSKARLAAKLAK